MNKYQRLQKWVFRMAVNTGHTTNVDKEYHDLLKELVDKATSNKQSEYEHIEVEEYDKVEDEILHGHKVQDWSEE